MRRYSNLTPVVTPAEAIAVRREVSAIVRTVPPTEGKTSRATEGVATLRRLVCTRDNAPRIYISGPMTGIPGYNFAKFDHVAEVLRSRGFCVLNPAEWPERSTWEEYLRFDVGMLYHFADRAIFLDGWENSRGAKIEMAFARGMELPIYFEPQLDEVRL